jgi:hypothetical protein
VNAWETGPYQPGHHVLSTRASCSGCWECRHAYPYCQWKFAPRRIAFVAARIAAGDEAGLASLSMPGVTLWRTGRNGAGLYHLDPVGKKPPEARLEISDFWTRYFGWAFAACGPEPGREAFGRLAADFPALARSFRAELPGLARRLSLDTARGGLSPDFHRRARPMLRPLTGYLELYLANADHAPGAARRALELVEGLTEMTGNGPALF